MNNTKLSGAVFCFCLGLGLVFAGTAQRQGTQLELFLLENSPPKTTPRGLFEPPTGVYLGAYVEQEPEVGLNKMFKLTYVLKNNHAIYFRYHRLLQPGTEDPSQGRNIFPDRFVFVAKNSGAAVHIALEPTMPLVEITKQTVQPFAEAARDAEIPIFVRFASEFNDPGNSWSADPALYVEKFRLVSRVLKEVAPNVAMVWTPMAYRINVIDAYYPGEDYVDWVGVNFYNTVFVNGDLKQSGWDVNPLALLEPIYKKYASRHPIQISEYAAAHHNGASPVDFSTFAAQKLRTLYYGVRLKYPRVKNINYFSVDAINDDPKINKRGPERLSNYSLLDSPAVLEAYQGLFLDPYFLQFVLRNDENLEIPPRQARPFPRSLAANTTHNLAVWVESNKAIGPLEYRFDEKNIGVAKVLPYALTLNTKGMRLGKHTLSLRLKDTKNTGLLERKFDVEVR